MNGATFEHFMTESRNGEGIQECTEEKLQQLKGYRCQMAKYGKIDCVCITFFMI
jgi:hypothetical protein